MDIDKTCLVERIQRSEGYLSVPFRGMEARLGMFLVLLLG
jgi:hypothetical protein